MSKAAILTCAGVGVAVPARAGSDRQSRRTAGANGQVAVRDQPAAYAGTLRNRRQSAEIAGGDSRHRAEVHRFPEIGRDSGRQRFHLQAAQHHGSEASVPVLVEVHGDPKTAELGRYALERIPGAAVDRALREALAKTKDRTRIGVINTLGVRRDAGVGRRPAAAGAGNGPAPTASAALFALAKIADPAAVAVLSEAQGKTKGPVHADAAEAYLQAANRLAERGSAASAVPIYKTLYASRDPGTVQAAALRGLAHAGGAQATPVLMEALHGSDARLQAIAIAGLMPGSAAPVDRARCPSSARRPRSAFSGCSPSAATRPRCRRSPPPCKGTSKPVRMAALQGIGKVANASVVQLARRHRRRRRSCRAGRRPCRSGRIPRQAGRPGHRRWHRRRGAEGAAGVDPRGRRSRRNCRGSGAREDGPRRQSRRAPRIAARPAKTLDPPTTSRPWWRWW